jgi:hypothetical protein
MVFATQVMMCELVFQAVSSCIGFSLLLGSRDSAVGIATGYWLNGRVPVVSRILFPPRRLHRFWDTPSLLSNRSLGLFLRW